MLAPIARRPASRSSIATSTTINDTSPSSSWSGRMPRSSRTSVSTWSDDGTEMPQIQVDGTDKVAESVTVVGGREEPPLIDFGEDKYGQEASLTKGGQAEQTPGDRLRMLLRQMEAEVRDTTPTKTSPLVEENKPKSAWRDGRRRILPRDNPQENARDDDDDEEEEEGDEGHSDEEDDSPPTPPLRITNPYLSRRNQDDRLRSSQSSQPRVPSRAAVLRNSSSSNNEASSSQLSHQRTPLETFIASHPVRPAEPGHPPGPSSYRSLERSTSSSSSSRKGKERALHSSPHLSATRTPGPSRKTWSQGQSPSPITRRPPATTPRRWSVEIAPEDSEVFAQDAEGLEIQAEMELDIEESGNPPWDADGEESKFDEPPQSKDDWTIRGKTTGARDRISRVLSHPTPTAKRSTAVENTSLPALPEPSIDESSEDDGPDTLSSRQASLFRSPKFSPRIPGQSHSGSRSRSSLSLNLSRIRNADIQTESGPMGTAPVSTPGAKSVAAGTTPHPPGRWYTPGKSIISPSRDLDRPRIGLPSPIKGDTSLIRLKVSPAKKSALPPGRNDQEDQDEGNSSFLGRIPGLSQLVPKRYTLPRPSTTLQEARQALDQAAQTSSSARDHVETTQQQLLEALAAAQKMSGAAVEAVKHGWGWGNWAWWVGMEMLLVWGVFRVTLDYASSAQYLAAMDPFAIQSAGYTTHFGLSVPLPSAVSAFVVPRRGSANFFDLLERAEVWSRLDQLGVLRNVVEYGMMGAVDEGARTLGGVPT